MAVTVLPSRNIFPALLVCLSFFLAGNAIGTPAAPEPITQRPAAEKKRKNDITHVLMTLKSRTPDREVLEKVEEKLCEMPAHKLSLVSSLCDRISTRDSAVGADLAYSLVSALIVLS